MWTQHHQQMLSPGTSEVEVVEYLMALHFTDAEATAQGGEQLTLRHHQIYNSRQDSVGYAWGQ